jgi:tRNA pseudouridine(38-40) synthase
MKRLRTNINAVDKQRGRDDIVTTLHDDNKTIHDLNSVTTDSHTLEHSDYNADCGIVDVDQHDNNNDLTITTAIVTDKYQHINTWYDLFISDRNWYYCESIWSRIIKHNSTISSTNVPDYIEGYKNGSPYGVSKLSDINQVGQRSEFISKNHKYLCRQTFALRIGYDGQQYYGYQRQKNFNGLTVEEDILKIIKLSITGAGRTDRGVSAISQIINFNTNNMNLTTNDIYNKFKQSKPCLDGRLTIYDCYRVPKKFHSRASATWRRYLYMFPLKRLSTDDHNNSDDSSNDNNFNNNNDDVDKDDSFQQHSNNCDSNEKIKFKDNNIQQVKDKYDVDVDYLNIVLSKLENRDLPYNAFAFKEDRVQG